MGDRDAATGTGAPAHQHQHQHQQQKKKKRAITTLGKQKTGSNAISQSLPGNKPHRDPSTNRPPEAETKAPTKAEAESAAMNIDTGRQPSKPTQLTSSNGAEKVDPSTAGRIQHDGSHVGVLQQQLLKAHNEILSLRKQIDKSDHKLQSALMTINYFWGPEVNNYRKKFIDAKQECDATKAMVRKSQEKLLEQSRHISAIKTLLQDGAVYSGKGVTEENRAQLNKHLLSLGVDGVLEVQAKALEGHSQAEEEMGASSHHGGKKSGKARSGDDDDDDDDMFHGDVNTLMRRPSLPSASNHHRKKAASTAAADNALSTSNGAPVAMQTDGTRLRSLADQLADELDEELMLSPHTPAVIKSGDPALDRFLAESAQNSEDGVFDGLTDKVTVPRAQLLRHKRTLKLLSQSQQQVNHLTAEVAALSSQLTRSKQTSSQREGNIAEQTLKEKKQLSVKIASLTKLNQGLEGRMDVLRTEKHQLEIEGDRLHKRVMYLQEAQIQSKVHAAKDRELIRRLQRENDTMKETCANHDDKATDEVAQLRAQLASKDAHIAREQASLREKSDEIAQVVKECDARVVAVEAACDEKVRVLEDEFDQRIRDLQATHEAKGEAIEKDKKAALAQAKQDEEARRHKRREEAVQKEKQEKKRRAEQEKKRAEEDEKRKRRVKLLAKQVDTMQTELLSITGKLKAEKKKRLEAQKQAKSVSEKLAATSDALKEQRDAAADLKAKLKEKDLERDSLKKEISVLTHAVAEANASGKAKEQAVIESTTSIEELETKIFELQESMLTLEQTRNQAQLDLEIVEKYASDLLASRHASDDRAMELEGQMIFQRTNAILCRVTEADNRISELEQLGSGVDKKEIEKLGQQKEEDVAKLKELFAEKQKLALLKDAAVAARAAEAEATSSKALRRVHHLYQSTSNGSNGSSALAAENGGDDVQRKPSSKQELISALELRLIEARRTRRYLDNLYAEVLKHDDVLEEILTGLPRAYEQRGGEDIDAYVDLPTDELVETLKQREADNAQLDERVDGLLRRIVEHKPAILETMAFMMEE